LDFNSNPPTKQVNNKNLVRSIEDIFVLGQTLKFTWGLTAADVVLFKCTSYDFKCSFGQYKALLKDNRHSMIFDNLRATSFVHGILVMGN
jgi:hypothetical protein